jgi:hypothetical protein
MTKYYVDAMDAIYSVHPTALMLVEGCGQLGTVAMNWGDGYATDAAIVKAGGVDDARPFFETIMTKPYANNVVISPHIYPPSISTHTEPDVVLAPGARCVVARNRAKFQVAHPNGIDPVAELACVLDNGGDSIRLFDPTGMLVEAVTYDDVAPWPATADGGGSTLQRIDPASDPGVAASWRASSTKGGSPGGP